MTADGGGDADVLVGAGIAGLAAADRLTQDSLRGLVLEREEEPGGRVRSEQWEGPLELGAVFVLPAYRRLLGLIEECGLSDRPAAIASRG